MVFDEEDRPQPRLDRDLGNGYTVSVGRVREDEGGMFDLKFVALSHNSEFFSDTSLRAFSIMLTCFCSQPSLALPDRPSSMPKLLS